MLFLQKVYADGIGCSDSMINPRSYFAPVGSSDFESPLKPRQPSQVRRSLTGSFSGPISDEELKQSFKAMRQSGSHTTAVGSSPSSMSQPDDEQAGVGIYFVKSEHDGKFFVQHILPGYAAEKCGSILMGDVVTHVGAYKLPPDLTLEKLRPLIVRAIPLMLPCSCIIFSSFLSHAHGRSDEPAPA
jgi:hypothetical protein